eukprot:jgi/Tetstr1/423622/TSEL_001394.t1
MKEVYVSVFAPSQRDVGISTGDSMLTHGDRLIAETLGPRAVIFHTDLCNEAWRRIIIQRHIDCSPLHLVIHALLCDNTLEVTCGAAHFNADDGYLVGLPEHGWPALNAFRTSIKASLGLAVRFDKTHAYNADTEAARREAPADMEWPELDGHHGIPGPQCAARITRGIGFVTASSKSEDEAFAEAGDATVFTAIERMLGVSFDPST